MAAATNGLGQGTTLPQNATHPDNGGQRKRRGDELLATKRPKTQRRSSAPALLRHQATSAVEKNPVAEPQQDHSSALHTAVAEAVPW